MRFNFLFIQKLDTEDNKVRAVAAHMVEHINSQLDTVKHLCSNISLKRILNAQQVIPNEKVMICMLPTLTILIILNAIIVGDSVAEACNVVIRVCVCVCVCVFVYVHVCFQLISFCFSFQVLKYVRSTDHRYPRFGQLKLDIIHYQV